MEQNLSWEAKRFRTSQEIARILRKPKVHYRVYKSLPPTLIQTPINPVNGPHSTYWISISILSSILQMGLPSDLFPSGLPMKNLCIPLLSPIHPTHPAHLILLDYITSKIFDEECRSVSYSLCTFLHSHASLSPLGPNILLRNLFSNTLSPRSSLNVSDKLSHPYKTTGKNYISVYLNTYILR